MIHVGRPAPWNSQVRIVSYFETWPRQLDLQSCPTDRRGRQRYMWHCWVYSDGWQHWERRTACLYVGPN